MFEVWSFFILIFAAFIGLGLIIYLLGNRKTRFEEGKYDTYTCGEPFPKVSIGSQNFYDSVKRNLGLRDLRDLHSGKLSDYLLWFLAGMVVVVFVTVMI